MSTKVYFYDTTDNEVFSSVDSLHEYWQKYPETKGHAIVEMVKKSDYDKQQEQSYLAQADLAEAFSILEHFNKHPQTSKLDWHNRRRNFVESYKKERGVK